MLTWATFRLVRVDHSAGFTLLELLVVMTILAALTGVAVPRMYALYEAGERSFERERVLEALGDLPLLAYRAGREYELNELPSEDSDIPVELPPGWALKSVDGPVLYKRTGICLGGRVDIDDGYSVGRYILAAPHCRPE